MTTHRITFCFISSYLVRCRFHCSEKRAELSHPDARYFIITRVEGDDANMDESNQSNEMVGSPVAFCHIRFTAGDDDKFPIAYVSVKERAELSSNGYG